MPLAPRTSALSLTLVFSTACCASASARAEAAHLDRVANVGYTGDPREAYLAEPRNFQMNGRPIGGIVKVQADAIFFVAEVHTPSRRRGGG